MIRKNTDSLIQRLSGNSGFVIALCAVLFCLLLGLLILPLHAKHILQQKTDECLNKLALLQESQTKINATFHQLNDFRYTLPDGTQFDELIAKLPAQLEQIQTGLNQVINPQQEDQLHLANRHFATLLASYFDLEKQLLTLPPNTDEFAQVGRSLEQVHTQLNDTFNAEKRNIRLILGTLSVNEMEQLESQNAALVISMLMVLVAIAILAYRRDRDLKRAMAQFSANLRERQVPEEAQIPPELRAIRNAIKFCLGHADEVQADLKEQQKHARNLEMELAHLQSEHEDVRSEKLFAQQQLSLYRQAFDCTDDAIVITDSNGIILFVNDAHERLTGYAREEVIGQNPGRFKSGHHDSNFFGDMWQKLYSLGAWQGEIWDRRKNGEVYPKWLTINQLELVEPDTAQKRTYYIGVFHDITRAKESERALEAMAFKDPLTGLCNRARFFKDVQECVEVSERYGNGFALLMMDLDRFKAVNDTWGHPAGDELLIQLAKRITKALRGIDSAYRLGGDEFAVLIREEKQGNGARQLARRLIDEISAPVQLSMTTVQVGASIGIALCPEHADNPEKLVQMADVALYTSKREGRGQYRVAHSHVMTMFDLVEQANCIRHAMDDNTLQLRYKPIMSVDNGSVSRLVVNCTWFDDKENLITGSLIINQLQDIELLRELSRYTITQICDQLLSWQLDGQYAVPVVLALSLAQLTDPQLPQLLAEQLDERNLPRTLLQIAISEQDILKDLDHSQPVIETLHQQRTPLILDDFTCSLTNLTIISSLPVQSLSLSDTLVDAMRSHANGVILTEQLQFLSRQMGVSIIFDTHEGDFESLIHEKALLPERSHRELLTSAEASLLLDKKA